MDDKNQDMIITEGEKSAVYGKSANRKNLGVIGDLAR